MKKSIFKTFVISITLLFWTSHLQAQYTVFSITGIVEMSADGKAWNPLKKKDELQGTHQIKAHANSSLQIMDANNFIYNYADTKIVSVNEILKQRKTIFKTINEDASKRDAIGGVVRGPHKPATEEKKISLRFYIEELSWYDDHQWDLIPVGSVFYIIILNETEEDKTINVYQKLETGELLPCFPESIWIEKNTAFEIEELLFVKQEGNSFMVVTE